MRATPVEEEWNKGCIWGTQHVHNIMLHIMLHNIYRVSTHESIL